MYILVFLLQQNIFNGCILSNKYISNFLFCFLNFLSFFLSFFVIYLFIYLFILKLKYVHTQYIIFIYFFKEKII